MLRYIEIRCIEARLRNLLFYTTLSDEPIRINARLADIESSLPRSLFVLCHRSYIVNIAHVRTLTRTECLLSNGESVPISRTYVSDINQAFDRYHQGGGLKNGIGLHSIEAIAQRAEGRAEFGVEGDVFHAKVVVPYLDGAKKQP